MSRLFPHPPYAEDQPYSHLILTTHVLHRGFQLGALLGATAGLSYSTYRYLRPTTTPPPPTTTRASAAGAAFSQGQTFRSLFLPHTLRSAGLGATTGAVLMSLAVTGRMWGREEIEWQDRAWRLLENEGQMSVDDWSLDGMAVGIALAVLAARRGVVVLKGRPMAVVGAAGLGSLVGTEGSVEWRAVRGTRRKGEGVVRG